MSIIDENDKSTRSQDEVAPPKLPSEATGEETTESHVTERPLEREKLDVRQGDQMLYSSEVDLFIPAPANLKLISELYESLNTMSNSKVLYVYGSTDQGVTITVALERPIPLISVISSKMPMIKMTPEPQSTDSHVRGKRSLLLRKEKTKVRTIRITLSEGNASNPV